MSPFLAWRDFHARRRFSRSTILRKNAGLPVVYFPESWGLRASVSSSPLPLPLPPFFPSRSNFRAITRLETLATQVIKDPGCKPVVQRRRTAPAFHTIVLLRQKSGGRGDVALNSLPRTCSSLKHPLSCKTLTRLECMAKSRVSF